MLDASHLLMRLGGVARGRELQAFGLTRQQLAAQVDADEIRRLRPGVFASPSTPDAVISAAEHGGALTCEAALAHHGVWTLAEHPPVHVWMGADGRRHPHEGCACVSHFFAGTTTLGVASVEDALVHLFRCAGHEAFFASFESAWRLRLLTRAARDRVRAALPTSARWLVDFARADSDSGLESLVRLRLHLIGIRLACQVTIQGVGRVDFLAGDRLIIEVDGRLNHASAERRHNDLVRDAAASLLGYETLRFDYAQVVHDWPSVERAILAAVDRADVRD